MIWLFTIDKTVQVKFSTSLYTGNVKDGVTVVATGVASFPYTVEIRPFAAKVGDIHEAQPGRDFDNKTLFVMFEQETSLQRVVNITVKNDTLGHHGGHNPEGFKALLHLSSDIGVDIGSPSVASIIVYD